MMQMLDNQTLNESIERELESQWRKMSPPTQLWKLLAPPDSTLDELTSMFLNNIGNETYIKNIQEAQWARFLRCAGFVEEFQIERYNSPKELYAPQRKLVDAVIARNNRQPIFPVLQKLCWAPSSKDELDMSYPLFTSTLHTANFDINYIQGDKIDDSIYEPLLQQLAKRSTQLEHLSINSVDTAELIGSIWSLHAITSFKHLTWLRLSPCITVEAFYKLAIMPTLEFLEVKIWRNVAAPESPDIQVVSAPRLSSLSISGTCTSLTHLFADIHLVAPCLVSISCDIISHSEVMWDPEHYLPTQFMNTFGASVCSHRSTVEALHDLYLQFFDARDMHMFSQHPLCLGDLVLPLYDLNNIKNFTLSCPTLELDADDLNFKWLTSTWTRLQTFTLSQHYTDTDEPIDVPTPAVLRYFCKHCPDLRELTLPYLDLAADIPAIEDSMAQNGSRHGLHQLVLAPNPGFEEGERKTNEWARYIHSLFPKLDMQESINHCAYISGRPNPSLYSPLGVYWDDVLECVQKLRIYNSTDPVESIEPAMSNLALHLP